MFFNPFAWFQSWVEFVENFFNPKNRDEENDLDIEEDDSILDTEDDELLAAAE